jgi:asparagine synthase (glutamine-hydrolysing)
VRAGVKLAETLGRPASLAQLYLLRRELALPDERRALHPLPAGSDPWCGLPGDVLAELDGAGRELDAVNQVSQLELTAYLRHMLLRDSDVFSMVHGLELRVPLLDHVLVEQSAGLPGAWKRPDPRPKPLLLDAVGRRMPASAVQAPKRGFTFPWPAWLRGPLQGLVRERLENRTVWERLGFAPETPPAMLRRFLRGDPRVPGLLLLALTVLADFAERHGLCSL